MWTSDGEGGGRLPPIRLCKEIVVRNAEPVYYEAVKHESSWYIQQYMADGSTAGLYCPPGYPFMPEHFGSKVKAEQYARGLGLKREPKEY